MPLESTFKLIAQNEIKIILPLLHELDPTISQVVLNERLIAMVEQGYQCLGIYIKGELIGICGIWVLVKYYIGKHLELDNVYIKAEYRNKGLGEKMNDWLTNYALALDCKAIELNCYVKNTKAQQFWEANEYDAIGMHFQQRVK